MIATPAETEFSPLVMPDQVMAIVLPRIHVNSFDWICEHVQDPKGRPFNPIDYPWTRGICEAYDDPEVREIVLQFAARLGKTLIAQALILSSIANHPSDFLFATASEDLVKKTVRKKLEPMIENCDALRSQLKPLRARLQTRIDLDTVTGYCGWSGSPTTLADIEILYSHAGEISKWTADRSDEADPLSLFLERGAEQPNRKAILESTPATAGRCRVDKKRREGTNRRYHVPCPHCGTYQELIEGHGDPDEGGLVWEKKEDGSHDANLAHRTAKYHCQKCHDPIDDHYKRAMCRKGVWCAVGQRVSKGGRLIGKPTNAGPVESFQLSRLYSHVFSFGDYAREMVRGKADEAVEKNRRNSWAGKTWTPRRAQATWEEVADRLCLDYELGTCPEGTVFVTTGIDHQVDVEVWVSIAWTREAAGYIVGYGVEPSMTDLKANCILAEYPHADGGPSLWSEMSLFDSAFDEDTVWNFCKGVNQPRRSVWPYLGARPGSMKGKHFRREGTTEYANRHKRARRGRQDLYIIHGNTSWWHAWTQSCLIRRSAGSPDSLAAPKATVNDQDFWEQMLNQIRVEKGQDGYTWIKLHEHLPDDFRDAARIARCAAEVNVLGAWNRVRVRRAKTAPSPPSVDVVAPARKTAGARKGFVRKPTRKGFIRRRT